MLFFSQSRFSLLVKCILSLQEIKTLSLNKAVSVDMTNIDSKISLSIVKKKRKKK